MIEKFAIYGERCSGTNYIEVIMKLNFDINITWEYGHKHFFGFNDKILENSDKTLFICIIRNPVDWINAFYRNSHHVPKHLTRNINNFLNDEFYSYVDNKNYPTYGNEILEDRNIYTGERYKNIYELRHTKLKWMIEDLPKKVKNYILIKHEDLLDNFNETLYKIKNKGLKIKENINFPINTDRYKKKNYKYVKKVNKFKKDIILSNPNYIPFYDKKLYNNLGFYWIDNSGTVYWSNDFKKYEKTIIFNNPEEYFEHRKSLNLSLDWSNINKLK